MDEYHERIAFLNVQIVSNLDELRDREARKLKLENSIADLSAEVDRLGSDERRVQEALKIQKKTHRNIMLEEKTVLADIRSQWAKMASELLKVRADVEARHAEISKAEERLSELQADVEARRAEISKAEERLSEMQARHVEVSNVPKETENN